MHRRLIWGYADGSIHARDIVTYTDTVGMTRDELLEDDGVATDPEYDSTVCTPSTSGDASVQGKGRQREVRYSKSTRTGGYNEPSGDSNTSHPSNWTNDVDRRRLRSQIDTGKALVREFPPA